MIAITGVGFRFPGASDFARLTRILQEGLDMVGPVPEGRAQRFPAFPEQCPQQAGYLEEVYGFDAAFFRVKGLEARYMDPQQRVMLEVAWQALEDAALPVSCIYGSATGVFVGAHTHDYLELCIRNNVEINGYWNAGLNSSILANRISYHLNLTGPSMTVNTACSSGLEALVLAVNALEQGQCEQALAGGVNLILTPTVTTSAARAGMLSPDGRCKAFDAGANGFVRGEGAAMLVLKPLKKARKDGDPIHAVIRSAASAHGGRANSLVTPNLSRQRDLLIQTWRQADCDPATVGYMEAHGTGTRLGDSIEVEALKEAFAVLTEGRTMSCGLGSIKTNFGHMEAAAGIAGVIKLCLAMRSRFQPATVHFREPGELLQLDASPFDVLRETRSWPDTDHPRRAGVSSFGFGGAYAHVVLEEQPETPSDSVCDAPRLILLSAQSPDALRQRAEDLADLCRNDKGPDLNDIAHTCRYGRVHMAFRLAVIATDKTELAACLANFGEGNGEQCFTGEVKGLVKSMFKRRKAPRVTTGASLENQARSWCEGAELPQEKAGTGKRVRLPVYPFQHRDYWLNLPANA